ncbi:MAG: DUF3185 family protein [Verrucomicrobia bacterium]|nr:DUF3185 family protein [Verrucomicrobiota bacterium]MCH8512389.1 DUF3185 family protein [Kiritimatiellia bacterium]
MNRMIGIALIVIGAILVYYGYSEGTSPVGEITEAITGSPPDRSLVKMIGGILLIVVGSGATAYRRK